MIEVKEVKLSLLDQFKLQLSMPPFEKKVGLFRLLAMTQNAWLGIKESLKAILKSESHPSMRRIVEKLLENINQWISFSAAMKEFPFFFTNQEVALVKSAEIMGNLPQVLNSIADELENSQKLKKKIKGAMTYPVMVLIFALLAVVILLIKVIPTIVNMFPSEGQLPSITVFMLTLSDFIKEWWWMLVLIGVLVPIVYKVLYEGVLPFKIVVDRLLLRAPVIGELNKTYNLYKFSRMLGDFYNAGVSPVVAIDYMIDTFDNYFYREKLKTIKHDLNIWLTFTESMEGSWLFSPVLVQIISVWEETGNFGEVLIKMANFYREDIETKLEALMKLIEPLMMAFIAVIVGTIVAAVFLPLADLVGQIGQ